MKGSEHFSYDPRDGRIQDNLNVEITFPILAADNVQEAFKRKESRGGYDGWFRHKALSRPLLRRKRSVTGLAWSVLR